MATGGDDGTVSDSLASVADSCMVQGNYDGAVEFYAYAASQARDDAQIAQLYSKRATALFALERWEEGIKDCSHVIEINDKNAKPYLDRGIAYMKLENLTHAYHDLQKAYKLDPNDQEIRIVLEDIKTKMGTKVCDGEDAKKDFADCDNYQELLKDETVAKAFEDPEVIKIMTEVCSNPMLIGEYQDNPKMKALLDYIIEKNLKDDEMLGFGEKDSQSGQNVSPNFVGFPGLFPNIPSVVPVAATGTGNSESLENSGKEESNAEGAARQPE